MTLQRQRCETCKNIYEDDLKGFTYCSKTRRVLIVRDEDDKIVDHGIDWRLTSEIGCLSHSSQHIDRKVITLCGSVKFWDEYKKWNAILTLQGNVVLSCGLSLKSGYEDLLSPYTAEQLELVKKDLDEIHLRKIDLSDGIFVLNVGGYIGESTKREIAYAKSKRKFVNYLEPLYVQEEIK